MQHGTAAAGAAGRCKAQQRITDSTAAELMKFVMQKLKLLKTEDFRQTVLLSPD